MAATETEAMGKRVPTVRENAVEAGRAGGLASGAARRQRRNAHWLDVLEQAIAAEPERVARSILRGGNAAATAAALKLVLEHQESKVRHLQDLDKRTSQLDALVCDLLDDVAAEERRKAQLLAENAALMQERRELERLRDELRQTVAAEADAAGFDLVDDDKPEA